jgi:hypothetical protein
MNDKNYVPVDDREAASILGEGIHTGLRKGTDAPEAPDLWTAIAKSDEAWSDALNFAIWGMNEMGYRVCRVDE